jgi:hypothetical protein
MKVDEIRAILLADWDPLNIGDNPRLSDEYDSYIPRILKLVTTGASQIELEQFLTDVETELGVTPESARSRRVAIRLASG